MALLWRMHGEGTSEEFGGGEAAVAGYRVTRGEGGRCLKWVAAAATERQLHVTRADVRVHKGLLYRPSPVLGIVPALDLISYGLSTLVPRV